MTRVLQKTDFEAEAERLAEALYDHQDDNGVFRQELKQRLKPRHDLYVRALEKFYDRDHAI